MSVCYFPTEEELEERMLFLLMRLRNPRARIVYVTSQPVHPMVLDYHLQLLIGIPASHARSRLTLLCAYDSSPQPLSQKILDRPRLLERIRDSIGDPISVPPQTCQAFFEKFERAGGVVEELIEAAVVRSPSVQLRINPRREVFLASTHEQILGGPANQTYLECLFPADEEYRITIQDLGLRIGSVLAEKGIIGRLSIDFLAWKNSASDRWNITALEINLRMGGTTHPMLALRFLTGGTFDAASGLFRGVDGSPKFYRASDNVQSPSYCGLLPEDLIEILTLHRLDFNHHTSTGVLFHMFGAVSQFGKFGVIAIGNSRDEADQFIQPQSRGARWRDWKGGPCLRM